MILNIANILDSQALSNIQDQLSHIKWRDGRNTAGNTAKSVKQNVQADLSSDQGRKLQTTLLSAIKSNPVLQTAARPKRFSHVLISKTKDMGHYGLHTDNAFMNTSLGPIRTDLSFSLFLSSPESYDGGELVVQQQGSAQSFKPQAGDLILYPSTQLHEVTPVTRGERLVCVGWIESQLRQAEHRDILFDLTNLRANLARSLPANSIELLTLNRNISNLLRMWGAP